MKPICLVEQSIDLSAVVVRLAQPEERIRWDELMRAHHYLGLSAMVGRSLRYVAQYKGQWLALIGWASAALKCAARDAWIGWARPLQWQRIGLIANNCRFLILPGPRVSNLASKVLGTNLARLSADWQAVHGQALVLAETFVDPSRFVGTCYKAANWVDVGATRGFAKSNTTYTEHGQSKRILLYPLVSDARAILSRPLPHPRLPRTQVKSLDLTDAQARALLDRLGTIAEVRSGLGRRHSQRSVLALAVCAFISGARSSNEMAKWIERANPSLLRRLRCRRDAHTQRWVPPSEPTLRRILIKLPVEQLEPVLGDWLQTPDACVDSAGKGQARPGAQGRFK
ncbi:MAG: DUF4338 domain-containing protein [Rhodoferax sp.]|nr:DUF4338 domain-containing protein [Rhodoferax sp.]